MLKAPAAGWSPPVPRWLPPLPLLAWPLAALSGWGAAIDLRPALQSAAAGPDETFRCLESARNPQAVGLYLDKLVGSEEPWLDLARRGQALRLATGMMGWTTRSAMYEVDCAQRAHDAERAVSGIVRVLALSPFFHEYYEQLAALIAAQPQLDRLLPPRVRQRLAYLKADPRLPRPDLAHQPLTIDEAADLYAALSWAIANGVAWNELDGPLGALARRYGDIQGVAQLVVMAVCAAPEHSFPWLREVAPVLSVGLRTPGAAYRAMTIPTSPREARALLPLAELLFPAIIEDCRRGTLHMTGDPPALALQSALIRLWGRSRLAVPPGAPSGAPPGAPR